MTNELQALAEWTFLAKCKIPDDVNELLVPGEEAVCAYKTVRDSAIFTNKRLIVKNSQGITGIKTEIYTLPYSSILMYSTENAGLLPEINAEVELWTKIGNIKIKLNRGVNIREVDKTLATYIL